MKEYLITIITINYNNCEGLKRTLESVMSQNNRDEFEYVVIDGDSTDGSKELLRQYSEQIDIAVSEPDSGIYNAMNKGVRRASGKYLLFINSGDWLYDKNVIKDVLALDCIKQEEYDIITGYVKMVNRAENIAKLGTRGRPQQLSWQYLVRHDNYIHHPSSFIRKRCLEKRPYDESLKIVSDWRFFLELYLYDGATYKAIDKIITNFDIGDNASGNTDLVMKERKKVIAEAIPPRILQESEAISPKMWAILADVYGAIPYQNAVAKSLSITNKIYKALVSGKKILRR